MYSIDKNGDVIKVSIVIPVFNMGSYLNDAISSIVRNIKEEVEVIIVNDGSTDDTRRIINELVAQSSLVIRVIHQANEGLANARNNGIKLAKGKYIIPLDADNRICSGYLIDGVNILEANSNIDIVYGGARFFDQSQDYNSPQAFDICNILLDNYIDACAIYRKDVWAQIGGYDSNMPEMGHEDWEFWINAFVHGFKFYPLESLCFEYRVREDSMLRTRTIKKINENRHYIYQKHAKQLFSEVIAEFAQLKQENLHLRRKVGWYENHKIKGALKLIRQWRPWLMGICI